MQRGIWIWLLLAAGFMSLLANSVWTKHQINEILARELDRDGQAEPDRRWQSRIKIRIRGSQHAGSGAGNIGAQSGIAKEERTVPAVQQVQAATSSSHGLSTDSIPRSLQRPDPTQGSRAAGSRSDKTISQLRLPQKGSTSASDDSPSAVEALSGLRSNSTHEKGQADRFGSAASTGSTAPSLSPAQGHAPGAASLSDLGQSPPAEGLQPEEEAPVQGAVSLAGAWNAALSQARAPSVFAAIPDEPTAAMLQYAAAPAPLPPSGLTCEAWLAQADQRRYSRDFAQEPVTVLASAFEAEEEMPGCDVPCIFTRQNSSRSVQTPEGLVPAYDAHPGNQQGDHDGLPYFRHMESISNFPDRAIDNMHNSGVQIVMSPQLSSDVPAGYLSWAEYDFMAPLREKRAEAVAFISNCGAQSFRLEAVQQLGQAVRVDSYGACEHNSDTDGATKEDVLPSYRFTLAFENSQEEDYVTEKYAQALVAGSVPVVIGAPNIEDYAIAPNSMLVLQTKEDIMQVGMTMQRLLQNQSAYEDMLAWKEEGPQDSFLALVDLNAVHSNCRLCVKLADNVRAHEETGMLKPPCKCMRAKAGATVHHVMVRERSTLRFRDLYLSDTDLTVSGLHDAVRKAFAGHVPVWANQRPDFRAQRQNREARKAHKGDLSIYKVYQVGHTQRAALYGTADLDSDDKVRETIENNACLQLEVILI